MHLSIFDLDHTLISADSDVLWTDFLVERGVLDEVDRKRSDDFYQAYARGELDIERFLEFQLQPLARYEPAVLEAWREDFVQEKIRPVVLTRAVDLLRRCRSQGHQLLIITATNRFVTTPIAELLGIPHLLATEVEQSNGRYTGRSLGTPCFREGKIQRLQAWLEETGFRPSEKWFYSDSRNDLPLLGWVEHPVAVDPDPVLRDWAVQHQVPIISLR